MVRQANRLVALDGLRAVSILAVMACHLLPLGPKPLRLNETAGAMGMSLFFALSGFLITNNLINGQSAFEFFVRRFVRILPLAYLYLVFVFFVVTFDPKATAVGLVFLENYLTDYLTLDGHFWSLCVEIHFYIIIGVLVGLVGKRAVYVVVPLCIAVTIMRASVGATIDIKTHLRVDEILSGAIVALLYHHGWLNRKASQAWLAGAAFLWFFASWPLSGVVQFIRPYTSALVLVSSLMLIDGIILKVLSSRPARYVAEISYALYVLHPLTAAGWMSEGSPVKKYLLKRPISFLASFALAHISTFYYERRWISAGKSVLKTRSSNVALPN